MKKIPTLFERDYENHAVTGIRPVLTSPDLLCSGKTENLAARSSEVTSGLSGLVDMEEN